MTLDDALDALDGPGIARVPREHGHAEVDVIEVDRLGVRVRSVRVEREQRDLADEAAALPGRLRALPDPVVPCEIAPTLGGATLRTDPAVMRGRYFEVQVTPDATEVRRVRVEGGERRPDDFVLTREQLGDLVDQLG